LSDRGRRQVERLLPRVRALSPESCITSPLARAAQTADILGAGIGIKPEKWDLLKEVDFGKLEGMTMEQARAERIGMLDRRRAPSGEFTFPDGEDFRSFEARAVEIANAILAWPRASLLVVAHGGILRGVLCRLLGVELNGPPRFRFAYAALASVETCGRAGATLTGFNAGREPLR
jgi:alpha-ribazole phosphatase